RRMQCGNNLKQLALSCHNYHDTFKTLPPAWLVKRAANGNPIDDVNNWGWGALILPFMEQQPLHDQLDVGGMHLNTGVSTPAYRALLQEPLAGYRCPSSVAPAANTNRNSHPWGTTNLPALATSNYIGVNGGWLAQNGGRAQEVGIFIEEQGRNFRDILDGTSNVLLLGERRYQHKDASGAIVNDGAGVVFGVRRRNETDAQSDVRGGSRTKINHSAVGAWWSKQGFSSQHPGGAMFAVADGSVSFVPETIEWGNDADNNHVLADDNTERGPANAELTSAFRQLCAMQDGQPVSIK
ncbi:MAG TPA: DUF1559 domain-containing protein, partial [Pirellulaceae bacterium]|nr:DUF1559 domain-containing protein [Pirellulaceae bacterium]